MRQDGFNIFELIVVLVLFAIISAVFFPAFIRYQKRDIAETAIESIEPLQSAIQSYAFEYHRLPGSADLNGVTSQITKPSGVESISLTDYLEVEIQFDENFGGQVIVLIPSVNRSDDKIIWRCDQYRTTLEKVSLPNVCRQY